MEEEHLLVTKQSFYTSSNELVEMGSKIYQKHKWICGGVGCGNTKHFFVLFLVALARLLHSSAQRKITCWGKKSVDKLVIKEIDNHNLIN